MHKDFPAELGALGMTVRLKRIADRMVHGARRFYRELGLEIEPNWHAVLLLLEQSSGLGVADIARRLGMTHPSVSSLVGQMVHRGYLELTDDPSDGRRRTVELTAKAKCHLPQLKKAWQSVEEAIDEMLRESGRDFLASIDGFERAMDARSFEERMLRRLMRPEGASPDPTARLPQTAP